MEEDLRQSEERLRALSTTLDFEVRSRTNELESQNNSLLKQSELLARLSHDLLHAQDEERRHIARELHDSAGQLLVALGMKLTQSVREAENAAPSVAKR